MLDLVMDLKLAFVELNLESRLDTLGFALGLELVLQLDCELGFESGCELSLALGLELGMEFDFVDLDLESLDSTLVLVLGLESGWCELGCELFFELSLEFGLLSDLKLGCDSCCELLGFELSLELGLGLELDLELDFIELESKLGLGLGLQGLQLIFCLILFFSFVVNETDDACTTIQGKRHVVTHKKLVIDIIFNEQK